MNSHTPSESTGDLTRNDPQPRESSAPIPQARPRQIAIFGPGMLGGSIAYALRETRFAQRLVLWTRGEKAFRKVHALFPDHLVTMDLAEASAETDLAILCTPVEAMVDLGRRLAAALPESAVVTDVGSVKTAVTSQLETILQPTRQFVGSHPMAGSERCGIDAADAKLLVRAPCFLTPTPQTQPAALAQVRLLWETLGCRIAEISPPEHDAVVATISHLPHLLAAALAEFAGSSTPTHLPFCGNGFRDTTRIAASRPDLWAGILTQNRSHLLTSLDGLLGRLAGFREELIAGDADALRQRLDRARNMRQELDRTI